MNLNSIWPTFIGVAQREADQCKQDHKDIYNLIKGLEGSQSFDNGENLGFVTDGSIHELPELSKLNNWIKKQVYTYCRDINWDVEEEDFFIADSWAVLSKNGASTHRPHIHANSLISTVYYVNAPKGSGLLCFVNPSLKWESWQPDYIEKTTITEGEYHVLPIAGQCVIFRSNLPHMTGQNNFTDESELHERICIAYTWNVKNLGGKSRGRRYGI